MYVQGEQMKNTIGVITLLLSQVIFAETIQPNQTETKLIDSDAAVIEVAPAAATMEEQSGFSRGSVVRSAFTREIAEREPTENLKKLTNDNGEIKFFTELRDMSGQTAIHRWEYDGNVVAEVKFNVKGPRWRVWSSKSLAPEWTGNWKVSVINGAGEVISEKNLSVDATAAAPAEISEPEATPIPESMQ